MMTEVAGSGGALFRMPYTRFLHECYKITSNKKYEDAANQFEEIYPLWTETALFAKETAESPEKKIPKMLIQISEKLSELSNKEKSVFSFLLSG